MPRLLELSRFRNRGNLQHSLVDLRRFATEFYCGAKLQELASRNRVKAQLDALDALDACGTFWKASWVVDGVDQLVDGEGTPNDAP